MVKFMAGFTAARQKKIAENCENCILTFTQFREEAAGAGYDFSKMKEMYGGYTYPSNELAKLIESAEKGVQACFRDNAVHEDMFITCLR